MTAYTVVNYRPRMEPILRLDCQEERTEEMPVANLPNMCDTTKKREMRLFALGGQYAYFEKALDKKIDKELRWPNDYRSFL